MSFSTYTEKTIRADLNNSVAMTKNHTHAFQEGERLSPSTLNQPAQEAMTGAQASYLKMLADEVREPSASLRT